MKEMNEDVKLIIAFVVICFLMSLYNDCTSIPHHEISDEAAAEYRDEAYGR